MGSEECIPTTTPSLCRVQSKRICFCGIILYKQSHTFLTERCLLQLQYITDSERDQIRSKNCMTQYMPVPSEPGSQGTEVSEWCMLKPGETDLPFNFIF